MITSRRGHIHIINLERVRQHACECDDAIHSHSSKDFCTRTANVGVKWQKHSSEPKTEVAVANRLAHMKENSISY